VAGSCEHGNLLVPSNAGNVLPSGRTVSFSRRTLLSGVSRKRKRNFEGRNNACEDNIKVDL